MSRQKRHELKCAPQPFGALLDGRKKFEYRQNDRGFQVDDTLILKEWDAATRTYSGRWLEAVVIYIQEGGSYQIPVGFCILGIILVGGDQGG